MKALGALQEQSSKIPADSQPAMHSTQTHKNRSDPWVLATVHTEVTVLDCLVEYSFIITFSPSGHLENRIYCISWGNIPGLNTCTWESAQLLRPCSLAREG